MINVHREQAIPSRQTNETLPDEDIEAQELPSHEEQPGTAQVMTSTDPPRGSFKNSVNIYFNY